MAYVLTLALLATLFTVITPFAQEANAAHGVCDLDIEPENDTNPTGTTHTLTARLVEGGPSPETAGTCNDIRNNSITVDFEIDCLSGASATYTGETGGNAEDSGAACGVDAPGTGDDIRTTPDLSCVINSNPSGAGTDAANSCTVSYTRDTDGQDEIVGWVDEDQQDNTDDSAAGEAFADNTANDTDAVAKFWSDQTQQQIDCGPEGDINPAGAQHTVTCTVRSAAGANPTLEGADVDYQVTGVNPTGPQHGCTTGSAGTCSFTYTGNNAGADTIQAWVNQDGNHTNNDCGAEASANNPGPNTDEAEFNDFCDQVEKTWQARTGSLVNLEPETDTNPNGTTHTVNATLRDQFGQVVSGQPVDFEIVSGPNQGQVDQTGAGGADMTCTTDAQGQCSVTYTDAAPFDANNATDTICGWRDDSDDLYTAGGNPNDGGDCTTEPANEAEEANDPNNVAIGGTGEGNDQTDTVLKTWTAIAPGAATTLDAAPNTDTNPIGTRHDIFVIARDNAGNPTTGQSTTQAATSNCNQASAGGATGACPTRVRADIQPGSANQSTGVVVEMQCAATGNTGAAAGATPTAANATHICSYIGANAGVDQVRVFYDSNDDGQFTAGEPNEIVQKTWSGNATSVVVTPTTDEAPIGICNPYTVTLTDAGGRPVAGTVDVRQTFQNPPAAGQPNQPNITFCNPGAGSGANPSGPNALTENPAGNVQSGPAGGGQPNTRHAEFTTDAAGQVTFGIGSDQTGTVNLQIWNEQVDNDVFEPANNEPGATATKTWTPGGQQAARNLTATPANDTNPVGTQHRITATVTNQQGQALPGVAVSMQFAAGSANNAGQILTSCTATNNSGVSTCTYTGNNAGTDTIIVFVNQGGTSGPDTGEPQQQVTKTWNPAPTGLTVDVTCGGTVAGGANQPPAAGENANQAETRRETCVNPLTDTDEVFTALVRDAANSPRAGVRVNFSMSVTNNGTTTNGVGSATDVSFTGGSGTGGAAVAECDTDANGMCSVTVTNPNPQNGDAISVVGTVAGQTNPGAANDTATKTWQSPVATNLLLTPRAATNQINTQHTVTATIQSQFGEAMAASPGVTVDFRIFSGPNNGVTQLDTPMTNGQATFTFTSPIAGVDRILACAETTATGGGGDNDICNLGTPTGANNAPAGGAGNEPFGEASKTWQTAAVTTSAVVLDMDADDPNAGPGSTPPGGCEVVTPTDPNRERTATNTIDPVNATGAGNFHRICASAFQGAAGGGGALAGAPITFTITGVGRIYAATPQGTCATNVAPAAGTTQTVTSNEQGVAFACLYSQQVGRTSVTASAGTPAVTDTGTKDWTVGTERARNIQLCHGDIAGTTCATAPETNVPGDDHQLTARVTDVQGNPVAGVPVQFRETGPAIFTPQGGSTATVTTDANGLASVLMTSDVAGTSTVVAEIMSGSGANNVRGPGATDDQCEAPAGQGGTPTAGNCISQTLTKNWTTATTPPPTSPGPPTGGWERDIDLQASKNRKTFGKNFTLSGTVELADPNAPASCRDGVTVEIRRDVLGGSDNFVLFDTLTTDSQGAFTAGYTAEESANYVAFVGHSGAGQDECAEGSSSPEPVLVRVAVRFKINKTKVNRGTRVTFRVKFLPCEGHERDKALLFKAIDGKFGKIGKKRTNNNCVAKFRKKVWKDTVFQARWPKQDDDHVAGRSRPKAVQVRGRR